MEPGSYRAQDFVEVHETDGDRDGLQEDRRQDREPEALDGDGEGHGAARRGLRGLRSAEVGEALGAERAGRMKLCGGREGAAGRRSR